MVRFSTLAVAIAVGLAFALPGTRTVTAAEHRGDMFYNYYVGPPGVPAQLYLCPRPTPPLVGHTWITYQPLMPHEFMYKHKRSYYRYYRDGSYTEAHVRYR